MVKVYLISNKNKIINIKKIMRKIIEKLSKEELDKTIKKEKILEKHENQKYSYGCVMAYFNIPDLPKYAESVIKDEDLYDPEGRHGIETEPHTTILYGLHNDIDHDKVLNILRMIKSFLVDFIDVSLFENDEFDVLKFDVETEELNILNEIFKNTFEFTSDYPDYHAHTTIAYLKPGIGKEYIDIFKNYLKTYEAVYFVYSKANGEKILIDTNRNETSIIKKNFDNMIASFYKVSDDDTVDMINNILEEDIDIEEERKRIIMTENIFGKEYTNGNSIDVDEFQKIMGSDEIYVETQKEKFNKQFLKNKTFIPVKTINVLFDVNIKNKNEYSVKINDLFNEETDYDINGKFHFSVYINNGMSRTHFITFKNSMTFIELSEFLNSIN